jgi:superfamily I DNA/RNA helicase
MHPNDVCIVSTNIAILRKLDQRFRLELNEKTQTTFESEEEHLEILELPENEKEAARKLIRDSRKFSFNLNSGLVKLSTLQSFKGLETQTAIYILMSDDNEEAVYTGITRAKKNLILFLQKGNKYADFFYAEVRS